MPGSAMGIAQPCREATRLKTLFHVGRNDGIASRGRQPRQQISEGQWVRERIAGNFRRPVGTTMLTKESFNYGERVFDGRGRRGAANRAE